MAAVSSKPCSRCGVEKPAADFSPDRRASTGLQPACRQCDAAASKVRRVANLERIRQRERDYYLHNKERVHANNRLSRARHPEKVKAGKKAWYEAVKDRPEFKARLREHTEANKEWKREYDREYRKRQGPEVQLERSRKWRAANPEKRAAIVHSYTARRRAQTKGGVSTTALAAWAKAARKVCYWCRTKCARGYHIDHYTPLSKGGAHELANLVIACGPCNLKKNAKDPLDFAREVGRLL